MLNALLCLPGEHDLPRVALAALICVLGSLLTMRLLARVRRNTGAKRHHFLFLAGLVAGGTVWTTHFAAMLGYEAAAGRAFEPTLTFVSLAVAILFSWAGFAIASYGRLGPGVEAGGVVFGTGIAAMHYLGMAAFEVPAIMLWDNWLIAASIILAAAFGSLATNRIARPITRFCKYGGSLAMILASSHCILPACRPSRSCRSPAWRNRARRCQTVS